VFVDLPLTLFKHISVHLFIILLNAYGLLAPLTGAQLLALEPGEHRQREAHGHLRSPIPCLQGTRTIPGSCYEEISNMSLTLIPRHQGTQTTVGSYYEENLKDLF